MRRAGYRAEKRAALIAGLLAALWAGPAARSEPCPSDIGWLRGLCGDGALAYQSGGAVHLVELSTGKTDRVGPGHSPEFSPDSTKLAWIDGDVVKGRLRRGDPTPRSLVSEVDPDGGVHWIGNTELVYRKRDGTWFWRDLSGTERAVPELGALGRIGPECDVKLGKDGVWSLVSGQTWRTSDGGQGRTGGNCSSSLSPDGRSVTGLHGDHKACSLTRIRPGGIERALEWRYDVTFDNHRWSSNDPRFVVCQNELSNRMVVIHVQSFRATELGEVGEGEVYGDFTVGSGRGAPWPEETQDARASAAAWPTGTQGLAFLWESDARPNTVRDAEGQERVCRVMPRGQARLGRHHEMMPEGGRFVADGDAARAFAEAARRASAWTVEMTVTPQPLDQRRAGTILALLAEGGEPLLKLTQIEGGLVARLRTEGGDHRIPLNQLGSSEPHHVVVSYSVQDGRGTLVGYLNGRRAAAWEGAGGAFSGGGGAELTFGGLPSGGGWSGHLEGVALYTRALSEEEARAHHQVWSQRIAGRAPAARWVVWARLLASNRFPEASAYPQSLVVYKYRVERVVEGGKLGAAIYVAHRGILNGRVAASVRDREVGSRHLLHLEAFEDHPELQSLQIVESDDAEAFDSPLYYSVTDTPAPPPG